MIKCWHYRRTISRSADEGTPLPPAAHTHLAQCPECRRFCETEFQIVHQLTTGASARMRQPPPPFLHKRIMASIAATETDHRRAAGRPFLLRPASLAMLALVLSAVLLWMGRPASKPEVSEVARNQAPPAPATATVPPMANPTTIALSERATNFTKPLDTELQAILHDARGAMTALADNFFPEQLRQSLLQETSAKN